MAARNTNTTLFAEGGLSDGQTGESSTNDTPRYLLFRNATEGSLSSMGNTKEAGQVATIHHLCKTFLVNDALNFHTRAKRSLEDLKKDAQLDKTKIILSLFLGPLGIPIVIHEAKRHFDASMRLHEFEDRIKAEEKKMKNDKGAMKLLVIESKDLEKINRAESSSNSSPLKTDLESIQQILKDIKTEHVPDISEHNLKVVRSKRSVPLIPVNRQPHDVVSRKKRIAPILVALLPFLAPILMEVAIAVPIGIAQANSAAAERKRHAAAMKNIVQQIETLDERGQTLDSFTSGVVDILKEANLTTKSKDYVEEEIIQGRFEMDDPILKSELMQLMKTANSTLIRDRRSIDLPTNPPKMEELEEQYSTRLTNSAVARQGRDMFCKDKTNSSFCLAHDMAKQVLDQSLDVSIVDDAELTHLVKLRDGYKRMLEEIQTRILNGNSDSRGSSYSYIPVYVTMGGFFGTAFMIGICAFCWRKKRLVCFFLTPTSFPDNERDQPNDISIENLNVT